MLIECRNGERNETMNGNVEKKKKCIGCSVHETDKCEKHHTDEGARNLSMKDQCDNTQLITSPNGVQSFYGTIEHYTEATLPKSVETLIMTYIEFVHHVTEGGYLPVYVRGKQSIGAGCYLVKGLCGCGGYGQVYDALLLDHSQITDRYHMITRHAGDYLHVAIKVVVWETTYNEPEVMKGFSGVNGICSVFEHDNLHPSQHDKDSMVKYKETMEWGPCSYYIITPYIESMLCADIRNDPNVLHKYIHKLLTSIATLHEVGLAHMDIKGSNFLMDKNGNSALIDFGLSEFRDSWKSRCPSCNQSQTQHVPTCSYKQWGPSVVVPHYKPMLYNIPGHDDLLRLRMRAIGDLDKPHDNVLAPKPTKYTIDWNTHQRVGTCGYIAPEALMMWPNSGTPCDVWAAGIVILMLMCNQTISMFQHEDSLKALNKLCPSIVGNTELAEAAKEIGADFWLTHLPPEWHLTDEKYVESANTTRELQILRMSDYVTKLTAYDCPQVLFPSSLYQLVDVMLDPNPYRRITAMEALQSKYMVNGMVSNI